jgi:hypothetical protein
MPVPDEWHDITLFFSDVRLHAEYGITAWLSADLTWALRIVHVDFRLEDAATRQPIDPPFGAELHHRTETIVGPGDPWLSLRAVRALGAWAFLFRAGVTLPVGTTQPNPFALGRAGQPHEHIQLGTGTVDPLIDLEVRRNVGRFELTAWTLAKLTLYANGHGYQAGNQLLGGVDAGSDLWTRRFRFTVGALVYHEQPERWDRLVEEEGNLGRTDLMLDTAVAWLAPRRWAVSLAARFPVYSHAVGAQLSTPAIFLVTVSRPFNLLR